MRELLTKVGRRLVWDVADLEVWLEAQGVRGDPVSVQRITRSETLRCRARVKSHGREVATRVFERKRDAVAWEQEQRRALRSGAALGRVVRPTARTHPAVRALPGAVAVAQRTERKTREADESAWRNHIEPRFGAAPLASITQAQVAHWIGGLIEGGSSTSTANRYLSTLRSMLAFAVADGRLARSVATGSRSPVAPRSAARDSSSLSTRCTPRRTGPSRRARRAVRRARTVPLPAVAHQIVQRWADARHPDEWLFAAPEGGPLSESNWKGAINWARATATIGRPTLRPHDLRHTAASMWLGSGADPKVVQRILGHASDSGHEKLPGGGHIAAR